MSTPPTGVGWACPSLLRASFFLRATAQQALGESSLELGEEDDLPAPAPEAMAAALALNLPEPKPSPSLLILAGAALQALLEQQPLPACAPEAIFGIAYSPALAALPGPAKVALLCASDMAVLPTPTTTVIVACLAQHYASLPRAAFETEVAAASPRAAGMALQWWSAMFGTGSYAGGAGGATHKSLPPVALGLDPWSPAEEHWARGLDLHTGSSQPPPPHALTLALAFGRMDWLLRHFPELLVCTYRTPGEPAGAYSLRLWDAASGRLSGPASSLRAQQLHQRMARQAAHRSVRLEELLCQAELLTEDSTAVSIVNLTTGARLRELQGHSQRVTCLCALQGGGLVVSGSEDATLRVWDAATGACLRVLQGQAGSVLCVCALEGGELASGGAGSGAPRVWDAGTGACLHVLGGGQATSPDGAEALGGGSLATSVVGLVALQGRRLASQDQAGSTGLVRLWDTASGACLAVLARGAPRYHALPLPGGCLLLFPTSGLPPTVWQSETGEYVRELEHSGEEAQLVAALGGGRLVSRCRDGKGHWRMQAWEASKGQGGLELQVSSQDFAAWGVCTLQQVVDMGQWVWSG